MKSGRQELFVFEYRGPPPFPFVSSALHGSYTTSHSKEELGTWSPRSSAVWVFAHTALFVVLLASLLGIRQSHYLGHGLQGSRKPSADLRQRSNSREVGHTDPAALNTSMEWEGVKEKH